MPKIICPGCGAEIDTDKEIAEFKIAAPQSVPDIEGLSTVDPVSGQVVPAVAIPRRGSAFFKIRKEK